MAGSLGDGNTIQHTRLPDVFTPGPMLFELMIFCLSIIFLFLQYVNLYQTVWWLPYSATDHTLNVHLIDENVLFFIITLLSWRPLFTLIYVTSNWLSRGVCGKLLLLARLAPLVLNTVAMGYFAYYIVTRYMEDRLIYLLFPIAGYFCIFGLTLAPLYDPTLLWPMPVLDRYNARQQAFNARRAMTLSHTCTLAPETVREEAASLAADFNSRLSVCLYRALNISYVATILPITFAEALDNNPVYTNRWNTIHYDSSWSLWHFAMSFIVLLLIYLSHFFPAKYLDLLRRTADHLAGWSETHAACHTSWQETSAWPRNSLVTHCGRTYRALGPHTAATPGSWKHMKFTALGGHPIIISTVVTFGSLTLVGYLFYTLQIIFKWSQVLNVGLLMLATYFAVYFSGKSTMILIRLYWYPHQLLIEHPPNEPKHN